MVEAVKQLRIFVASPGDCNAEREAVRRIARQDPSILTLRRNLNVSTEVFGWEDLPSDLGRGQAFINAAVEAFKPDWFVFIFWHRFGSDAGLGMTGCEEEWELARRMHEQGGGRPWVSIYFNQADPPWHELDGYQFETLKKFRQTIFTEHQALAAHFRGTRDFEDQFRAHLTARLLELSSEGTHGKPSGIDRLKQELLAASQGLLHWPRTLGNNRYIERPELQQLLERTHESESSTTLVLGTQGTGKSALLATMGHHLLDEGANFLAIKADMLGISVQTPEDLRSWLHLSVDPRDAIRALAEKELVVLLIDQLDAVSELVDQRSGRLNLLLNLIQYLAGTPRVHIVAASREFEFRHDVRLSSISAEKMELELPTWEQIAPLLTEAGHDPNSMGQPLRDLLCIPLHLKLFLDVAEPGSVFESLQILLDRLWEQRVLNAQGPSDRLRLLERLASHMAQEEALWLPSAAADDHPEARQALEQAEILTRIPDGQTIGFRHQTYYDYTMARAFARGSVSLADHVHQRQDGLFVRPTLLSGLHYLRGTSRAEYHRQLRKLIEPRPRLHIRTLVFEFLGAQKDPDDTEVAILLPILDSQEEGLRVLSAVAGSPGWFVRLRHHPTFVRWMQKPPEEAAHCIPFLGAATRFADEQVLDLLEACWFENAAYDPLSFKILLDLNEWNSRTVDLAAKLARRSAWWGTEMLVNQMAESVPDLAPRALRADLDRRLEQALGETPEPLLPLPADADEMQRALHLLAERDRRYAPLRRVIENEQDWHDMETLAEASPKAFLDGIWPWFLDVVLRMPDDDHPVVVRYRSDHATYCSFDDTLLPVSPIIRAILAAISALAEQDDRAFLSFVREKTRSDLMIVHRLLAHGLECIAAQEPELVLEYLLGDPRRLSIGDHWDTHRESGQLIGVLCPHLPPSGQMRLEEAIFAFTPYKEIVREGSAEERFQRLKWARQDRLRLLRAFPEGCLSEKAKRLKAEEERALPETNDQSIHSIGGWVGPRVTAIEMGRASDAELLRLFDELPDTTEWEDPRRRWSEDSSRAGGAVQLSREFGQLAKQAPARAARLLQHLQPQRHEHYAGAAVEGIADTDFPTADLINLVELLDQRGFVSGACRDAAALALEKRAKRDKGLSDTILARLEKWLADHPEPILANDQDNVERRTEQGGGPILFGPSGSFPLPHGRGYIVLAVAAGYLTRQIPDLHNWARVIESRLEQEQHPSVWAMTLLHMPMLFKGDPNRATDLFDAVIRACPAALHYPFALQPIARVLGWCQPKERVHDWLARLVADDSLLCHQAYGELLVLYHHHHQDTWSESRIRHHLANPTDASILRGLAYGASYLWRSRSCQPVAREILRALASSRDESVQPAVAAVFRLNREDFDLNPAMREIIAVVCESPPVLLRAAVDLVEALAPLTGTEPAMVSQVSQEVLKAGGTQLGSAAATLSLIAETLTNIALTLHRQEEYRHVGLDLFEQLLSLNVQEARYALDLLDRRPTHVGPPLSRSRRRRR